MIPLNILIDVEKVPIFKNDEERSRRLYPDVLPTIHTIGILTNGTENGKPVVVVRIDGPDGKIITAQTTLALFQAAIRAFTAVYGDQNNG